MTRASGASRLTHVEGHGDDVQGHGGVRDAAERGGLEDPVGQKLVRIQNSIAYNYDATYMSNCLTF